MGSIGLHRSKAADLREGRRHERRDVAVGEQDALRLAGGAGGVHEDGDVGGRRRGGRLGRALSQLLQRRQRRHFDARRAALGDRASVHVFFLEDDDALHAGAVGGDVAERGEELAIGDDERALALVDAILRPLLAQRRIDRPDHQPLPPRRQRREHPAHLSLGIDDQLRPRADTRQRGEAGADRVDARLQLGVRDERVLPHLELFAPLAVDHPLHDRALAHRLQAAVRLARLGEERPRVIEARLGHGEPLIRRALPQHALLVHCAWMLHHLLRRRARPPRRKRQALVERRNLFRAFDGHDVLGLERELFVAVHHVNARAEAVHLLDLGQDLDDRAIHARGSVEALQTAPVALARRWRQLGVGNYARVSRGERSRSLL